jgi:hypothetical protein
MLSNSYYKGSDTKCSASAAEVTAFARDLCIDVGSPGSPLYAMFSASGDSEI